MLLTEQLDKLLPKVEKPGRYIGSELHSILKKDESELIRFGFAFPDTYEIGMSYLGLQILYKTLNDLDYVFCERIFAPAIDMENLMRQNRMPLFTLESKTLVKELDLLGFTLQYELSYTNIINMLNLSEIPIMSRDRDESDPFVIAGGPCAFNSEPLADVFDFIIIGDGEEVLPEICEIYKEWKDKSKRRDELLLELTKIEGVYVPSFYNPIYKPDGSIENIKTINRQAPNKVLKRIVKNLNEAPFPTKPIVPLIEVVHDRSVVELFRGCTRGCRFCQAGMIYRPVRERTKECVLNLIKEQLKNTGYDEVSLLSLSTSDYSQIEELVSEFMEIGKKTNVSLSLPSLRLDTFSLSVLQEIQGYKKTSLTFAPEAGTQYLRDVVNKSITDEDIYGAVQQAIELGWTRIKLYFMIGLPKETYKDLDGIVEIAKNIMDAYNAYRKENKCGSFRLSISVSNFVPKAHTPFQWCSQNTPDEFKGKHEYLRERLKAIKGVQFNYHDTGQSCIEAAIAKGDRRVLKAIIRAWELGCKFDSWREHFNYNKWLEAFEDSGVDLSFYAHSELEQDEILAWDIIDSGVSKEYLWAEWEKAKNSIQTEDCRQGCTSCGIDKYINYRKTEVICTDI